MEKVNTSFKQFLTDLQDVYNFVDDRKKEIDLIERNNFIKEDDVDLDYHYKVKNCNNLFVDLIKPKLKELQSYICMLDNTIIGMSNIIRIKNQVIINPEPSSS